jgi:hypothetical protein
MRGYDRDGPSHWLDGVDPPSYNERRHLTLDELAADTRGSRRLRSGPRRRARPGTEVGPRLPLASAGSSVAGGLPGAPCGVPGMPRP